MGYHIENGHLPNQNTTRTISLVNQSKQQNRLSRHPVRLLAKSEEVLIVRSASCSSARARSCCTLRSPSIVPAGETNR